RIQREYRYSPRLRTWPWLVAQGAWIPWSSRRPKALPIGTILAQVQAGFRCQVPTGTNYRIRHRGIRAVASTVVRLIGLKCCTVRVIVRTILELRHDEPSGVVVRNDIKTTPVITSAT